jgi:hypothetical protein
MFKKRQPGRLALHLSSTTKQTQQQRRQQQQKPQLSPNDFAMACKGENFTMSDNMLTISMMPQTMGDNLVLGLAGQPQACKLLQEYLVNPEANKKSLLDVMDVCPELADVMKLYVHAH